MERTSHSHLRDLLPASHGAEEALACLVTLFARLPRHLRRSRTSITDAS